MCSFSQIWLISVGWGDTTYVDFLVRSSSQLTTKLDIYHWFFNNIENKIVQFDYSPLVNIEGDLDLSQLFNKDIEHGNLNINDYKDFLELDLNEIELYMCENGKCHGMIVTVNQAKEQNYQIINLDNDPLSTIWKITRHPRYYDCIPLHHLENLSDIQQKTRRNCVWKILSKEEHHVYEYIFRNLNQFNIDHLPQLMNKSQEELIDMVQIPLEKSDYRILSEMTNIQCCQIPNEHIHQDSEQNLVFIYVEPSLDVFEIIDI